MASIQDLQLDLQQLWEACLHWRRESEEQLAAMKAELQQLKMEQLEQSFLRGCERHRQDCHRRHRRCRRGFRQSSSITVRRGMKVVQLVGGRQYHIIWLNRSRFLKIRKDLFLLQIRNQLLRRNGKPSPYSFPHQISRKHCDSIKDFLLSDDLMMFDKLLHGKFLLNYELFSCLIWFWDPGGINFQRGLCQRCEQLCRISSSSCSLKFKKIVLYRLRIWVVEQVAFLRAMLCELLFDDHSRYVNCCLMTNRGGDNATHQPSNEIFNQNLVHGVIVMSTKRKSTCIQFTSLEGGKEMVRKQVCLNVVIAICSNSHLFEYEAIKELQILSFGIHMKRQLQALKERDVDKIINDDALTTKWTSNRRANSSIRQEFGCDIQLRRSSWLNQKRSVNEILLVWLLNLKKGLSLSSSHRGNKSIWYGLMEM